ncbi:MAG TPA: hypothetical protein VFR58_10645 [Flavisolibacter sp.]|nr:hypothetical protein [Flavisolibacter sp.]
MKPNCQYVFVFFLLLTITIAGCKNRQEENNSSMTETELLAAANRLDSMFLAAFNRGDVNAFMELYWNSPDLTAYPHAPCS